MSYDKDEHLQKFLERNTLEIVFDLEEKPTKFNCFITSNWVNNHVIVFEYDRNVHESIWQEIKNYDFSGRLADYKRRQECIQKIKDWPFRARLIVRHVNRRPQEHPDYVNVYISNERHEMRETWECLNEKHPNYKPIYEEKTYNF